MARFLVHDFSAQKRREGRWLLAFGWALGLICGYCLFLHTDDPVLSLMRTAVKCRVSISGLVNVTLIPFLISAMAVSLSRPRLLALVAWGKAFSFAFVSLCTLRAFGGGGWLAWPLVMFSDICVMPVLWLYWLRHISGGRGFSLRELVPYLLAAGLIGVADHLFISPFLAGL